MALSGSLAIELTKELQRAAQRISPRRPFSIGSRKALTGWKKGGTANNGKGTNYGNKNSRSFNEKCNENLWLRDC